MRFAIILSALIVSYSINPTNTIDIACTPIIFFIALFFSVDLIEFLKKSSRDK